MQFLQEENENIPTKEWSKLDRQLLREEQSDRQEWIAAQATEILGEPEQEELPVEWSKEDEQVRQEELEDARPSDVDNQIFYDPGLTREEQLQLRREEMEATRGAEDQERQNFVEEMVEDITGDGDTDDW